MKYLITTSDGEEFIVDAINKTAAKNQFQHMYLDKKLHILSIEEIKDCLRDIIDKIY